MNSVMQKPLSIDINNNEEELLRETDESINCNLQSSSSTSPLGSSSSAMSDSFQEKLKEVSLDQMIRGQTPAGIENRCLELCRAFIGGLWSEAKGVEEISVKRLSGGFTNQLYHVRLISASADAAAADDDDDFPTEVAIKFYQAKHMKNYHADDDERLNDVIILSMVSEMGITPKVYGIFQEGFVQEFIKHEQFVPKHQQIPKCLEGCAQLQAKIHSLKVPIRKDSSWIFRIMRECFQTAYDQCALQELIDQLQLDAFMKQNPLEEIDNLEKLVTEVNSPLAFSHIDFNRTNVLVVNGGERVVTVDMEHCAYAPRAYDLATFLSEWDRELFAFHTVGLPTDAVLQQYVQLYISAADQLQPGFASKAENSVEKIVKEVKVFILVKILFIIGVSVQMREAVIEAIPFNEELKMESCNNFFRIYLQVKEQLIEQGVIQQKC